MLTAEEFVKLEYIRSFIPRRCVFYERAVNHFLQDSLCSAKVIVKDEEDDGFFTSTAELWGLGEKTPYVVEKSGKHRTISRSREDAYYRLHLSMLTTSEQCLPLIWTRGYTQGEEYESKRE